MRSSEIFSRRLLAAAALRRAPAVFRILALGLPILLFSPSSRAIETKEIKILGDVRLQVGGEVRMRGYYLDNFLDMSDSSDADQWSVFRIRTRVYVHAFLERNVFASVRIGNQHFSEGVTSIPLAGGDHWEQENKSNKFFVDEAYVDAKQVFGLPLDLQIGRQNPMYGTGWIVMDGQSQYGSTSAYLDGLRLAWHLGEQVTLDGLYFKDEERDRSNAAPDDITLMGVYFTSTAPLPIGRKQEFYALGRKDELILKEIYMFGGRLSNAFESGVDYSAEGAWQTGRFAQGMDQRAYGLKLDLGYRILDAPATPRFYGQLVRFTGDDFDTPGRREAWDVYYGGWPQFGDLLVWKYINAGAGNAISRYDPAYALGSSVAGEAVYSNFNMYTGAVDVWPLRDLSLKLTASYSRLAADETAGTADDEIGDYYQLGADYRYSKNVTFSFYGALLDPGAAFGEGADPAAEGYWDITLSF